MRFQLSFQMQVSGFATVAMIGGVDSVFLESLSIKLQRLWQIGRQKILELVIVLTYNFYYTSLSLLSI